MLIKSIIYSSDTLTKIDEMLRSNDIETCKLALSMCLQELSEHILNYDSEWLYNNFKIGLVKDVIQKGINCDCEQEIKTYCWAIHLILDSFKCVLTEIV